MRKALYVLAVLLVLEVAIAFSPVAEGTEGTSADMVGDIVWTAIFLTAGLLLILGIVTLVRRRKV